MVLGPFGFCGIEFRPPTAQLILSSASMRPELSRSGLGRLGFRG